METKLYRVLKTKSKKLFTAKLYALYLLHSCGSYKAKNVDISYQWNKEIPHFFQKLWTEIENEVYSDWWQKSKILALTNHNRTKK